LNFEAVNARANLLRSIRDYFYAEGVIEITTPSLGTTGTSDPHLVNLTVTDNDKLHYLQTSPEFAMKRLLATVHRSIYQICPAFRGGEAGNRHRIEFQMLEWYRCDYSLVALMDDLCALLNFVRRGLIETDCIDENAGSMWSSEDGAFIRCEYRDLFEDAFNINPHDATVDQLAYLAVEYNLEHLQHESAGKADYLDGLFALVIEPALVKPTLVFDFPAEQAALSRIKQSRRGDSVADRFEFYLSGMEVANAYNELTDADELQARIEVNNGMRTGMGLPVIPEDRRLLDAMNSMPECSGIALGVDRLLMALMGYNSIEEVVQQP
jgi:lysyl-tRNA synthetase class 2